MNTIHERLKKYRAQKGLTIQQVSQRTGIPASTYKEWEHGRQIRGEPYAMLAQVFEISLQELITGEKSQASSVLKSLDDVVLEIQRIKSDLIAYY